MEATNIKLLEGREGFDQIQKQDWDLLAGQLNHRGLSHEYEGYKSYVYTIDNDSKIFFLSMFSGNSLIAICPMESSVKHVLGIKMRVLQNIGAGSDFIWEKKDSNKNVLKNIIDYLTRLENFKWSAIAFSVLDDSSIYSSLQDLRHPLVIKGKDKEWYFLDCDRPYDDLRKGLSRNFKHNLKQSRNRLSRLEDVEFLHIRNMPDLQWAYKEFVDLEGSGWKGEGGTAIRQRPELNNFYENLIKNDTGNIHCVIDLLRVKGKNIAGQLSIQCLDTISIVKVGFNEEFSYLRPGVVLFDEFVKECCGDSALKIIDTTNDSEWVKKWKPSSRRQFDIILPRNTLSGMLYYILLKIELKMKKLRRKIKNS